MDWKFWEKQQDQEKGQSDFSILDTKMVVL